MYSIRSFFSFYFRLELLKFKQTTRKKVFKEISTKAQSLNIYFPSLETPRSKVIYLVWFICIWMGSDECSLSSWLSLTLFLFHLSRSFTSVFWGAQAALLTPFVVDFTCVHDAAALCTRLYGKMFSFHFRTWSFIFLNWFSFVLLLLILLGFLLSFDTPKSILERLFLSSSELRVNSKTCRTKKRMNM